MSFLSNRVLDYGIAVLTHETDTLYVCTDLPATYEQASETFAIAVKLAPQISEPFNSEIHSGRDVTVGPISDGEVKVSGIGTFWALVNSADQELLAAGPMWRPEHLTRGNLFKLNEFLVGIPSF